MIKIRFISVGVLPALLMCSCESMSPTDRGVVGGGLIGGGLGAVAGHALGNTAAGAVLGAVAGGVTGGVIGNSVERSEQRSAAQLAAADARRRQIGIPDIVEMVHAHVSDDLIVSEIRSTNSVFHLTAQDTIFLRQNGVSEFVVQEMMATAGRQPPRYYTAAPAYPPPGYYYDPYYAGPQPVVGVGFGYTRYGRRW